MLLNVLHCDTVTLALWHNETLSWQWQVVQNCPCGETQGVKTLREVVSKTVCENIWLHELTSTSTVMNVVQKSFHPLSYKCS